MLPRVGIDGQGRDGADGPVLPGRASKQEFSFHMVGWGAFVRRRSRRCARCSRRSTATRARRRQLGPLLQPEGRLPDRAGAAAGRRRERKREGMLQHATELAMEDLGHADPLPVHDLGDAKTSPTRRAPTSTRSRSSSGLTDRVGDAASSSSAGCYAEPPSCCFVDVAARVRRRVRDRQPDRHPDQPAGRPDRPRARDRARSASTSRCGSSTSCFLQRRADAATSASRSCTATSALQLILERMPATLELAFAAMLIAIVLGIPLGLWAGLQAERRRRHARSWPARSSASRCRRSGSG